VQSFFSSFLFQQRFLSFRMEFQDSPDYIDVIQGFAKTIRKLRFRDIEMHSISKLRRNSEDFALQSLSKST